MSEPQGSIENCVEDGDREFDLLSSMLSCLPGFCKGNYGKRFIEWFGIKNESVFDFFVLYSICLLFFNSFFAKN